MCLHLCMWVEEETKARTRDTTREPFQLVGMLLSIWAARTLLRHLAGLDGSSVRLSLIQCHFSILLTPVLV